MGGKESIKSTVEYGIFKVTIILLLICSISALSATAICWENYSLDSFKNLPSQYNGYGWSIDKDLYIGTKVGSNFFSFPLSERAVIYFEWINDFDDPEYGNFIFTEARGEKHYCKNSSWEYERFPVESGEVKWSVQNPKKGYGRIRNLSILYLNEECESPITIIGDNHSNSSSPDYNPPIDSVHPNKPVDQYGPRYVSVNKTDQNDTNYIYTTIKEALQVVEEPGVVEVQEGIYEEQFEINKILIFKGLSKNSTIIKGELNKDTIRIANEGVVVENITIIGGETGILIDVFDNCTIKDNEILDCNDAALYLNNSSLSKLTNNTVKSCTRHGILLENSSNYNYLKNNIILNCDDGICITSSVGNKFINNTIECISGCIYLTDRFSLNSNNFPEDLIDKSLNAEYICKIFAKRDS